MFENINILTKLFSVRNDITDIDDLIVINNLIQKYNLDDVNDLKECSVKDFASNSKFIKNYIKNEVYPFLDTNKAYDLMDDFWKSSTLKDLVMYRFHINKKASCYLKNTYRDTLNIYTIETINKYFKL